MSPIAPFYADRLWRDLTSATERGNKEQKESVHLCAFPQADDSIIDAEQEERMRLAQQLTSMILSLRKNEQIVVKQPLQKVAIPATDAQQRERLEAMKQLILDEVNVKEMEFVEAEGVLVKQVKCNFRVMGKKFGALMKNVNATVQAMTQQQISQLEHDGSILLTLASGDTANVELADVEIFSQRGQRGHSDRCARSGNQGGPAPGGRCTRTGTQHPEPAQGERIRDHRPHTRHHTRI